VAPSASDASAPLASAALARARSARKSWAMSTPACTSDTSGAPHPRRAPTPSARPAVATRPVLALPAPVPTPASTERGAPASNPAGRRRLSSSGPTPSGAWAHSGAAEGEPLRERAGELSLSLNPSNSSAREGVGCRSRKHCAGKTPGAHSSKNSSEGKLCPRLVGRCTRGEGVTSAPSDWNESSRSARRGGTREGCAVSCSANPGGGGGGVSACRLFLVTVPGGAPRPGFHGLGGTPGGVCEELRDGEFRVGGDADCAARRSAAARRARCAGSACERRRGAQPFTPTPLHSARSLLRRYGGENEDLLGCSAQHGEGRLGPWSTG
jgi:hypothetical protein